MFRSSEDVKVQIKAMFQGVVSCGEKVIVYELDLWENQHQGIFKASCKRIKANQTDRQTNLQIYTQDKNSFYSNTSFIISLCNILLSLGKTFTKQFYQCFFQSYYSILFILSNKTHKQIYFTLLLVAAPLASSYYIRQGRAEKQPKTSQDRNTNPKQPKTISDLYMY